MTKNILVTLDTTVVKNVMYTAIKGTAQRYLDELNGGYSLEELREDLKHTIEMCDEEITLIQAEEILRP